MPYYIYNTLSSVFDEFGFKIIKQIFAILNHFNEIAKVHNYQYFLTNIIKIKIKKILGQIIIFLCIIFTENKNTYRYSVPISLFWKNTK